jgi:hypothetical protein
MTQWVKIQYPSGQSDRHLVEPYIIGTSLEIHITYSVDHLPLQPILITFLDEPTPPEQKEEKINDTQTV